MNPKILHAALFMLNPEGGWGCPILLWGPPGTGKTAFIGGASKRYSMAFERLSPAEKGEGMFGVVPVPGNDGFLHYPAPDWSRAFEGKSGLIFVDEINTAVPALQAPLLGLVQLRTLGSHKFDPRTRVVAAANETSDAAGGWDLAPALANRFGHFDWRGMDSNDWVVAMIGGFSSEGQVIDAEVEERRVLEAWPSAIATARGLVAGFIKARPELLDKRPDKKSKHASRAFPTPRTVEYATYALASAMVHGLDESETDLFVSGFVGDGWFGEFATYRKHVDLPDIADLLDKKISWKHDPRRLDRTMAVLSAGAALISPANAVNRKDRAKAFWEILGGVSDDAADVVVPAARAMRLAQPPLITKEFGAVGPLSKLHPLMKAIGLVS